MTSLQFIQLILDTYKKHPDNMQVIIGNSNSGLQFNTALRMPLQHLRQIYMEEKARTKENQWIKDQGFTQQEIPEVPKAEGTIIRGKPLK